MSVELDQVHTQEVANEWPGPGETSRVDGEPENLVEFRPPASLSPGEWRKVRLEVDEFSRKLAILLSTYLRVDLDLEVSWLGTAPFSDFVQALPASTHLTLLKLAPLSGVSILEIRHTLALAMIDRVLGGPGRFTGKGRVLTEMEIALTDQIVQLIVGEWCGQWKRFQELRPAIVTHETHSRFLHSSTGDTVMILLTLEVRLGESGGPMQLAIPYTSFEPILAQVIEIETPVESQPVVQPAVHWNRSFESVPITLHAQWAPFKLAARELLRLQAGEFFPLEAPAAETVELCVGQVVKFRGRLGTREKKWAIQITEVSRV